MQSREIRKRITESLNTVSVIDPHCHLNPIQLTAGNLADLLFYHHVWIELVSSGMDKYEVTKAGLPHEMANPEMEPFERVKRALPHLTHIRNTTIGLFLRWILSDLYGIREYPTSANLKRVYELIEKRAKEKSWGEKVLSDFCHIEHSITVEGFNQPFPERLSKASEALTSVNITDGKNSPHKKLLQMEAFLGREIRKADHYKEFVRKTIRTLPVEELKYLGAWLVPYLTEELADEASITRILKKVKKRLPLNHSELGSFSYFGIVSALEELRHGSLRTIQVIVGAEVLLPHRSITHWSGNFVGALGRLACQFEEFHFNVSSASDAYTQDIAILAKHIPNISVAGYWWHTLYPFYIKKSLETRLDVVPIKKVIGYFSDAYHCEWCYPKLKLVKQILGEILYERVIKGWYDLDTALDIIRTIFYDAPKGIYHV